MNGNGLRKLPIGVQGFPSLRGDGFVYVDKTEYIYKLTQGSRQYFLSRPRRFGKSLLLSTMRAYWEGRKELFSGLAIERLAEGDEDAWRPYPVFYFDFNKDSYQKNGILEVEYGFLNSLAPAYMPETLPGTGKDILSIKSYLEMGDTESLRDAFAALYASIPYTAKVVPFEHDFQTVIYLVFTLLGQYVHAEVHSARGRADCVAEVRDYVYLFEFKRDGTADEALAQIEEKNYAAPYAADSRRLIRVGVSFDSEKRALEEWKTIE
ncbi:MAG: ATP-binding protein [Lachnospiraceae bacterium]|nr:ATP-binding protein [Lachnospiraceae bacterium]